MDEHRYAGLADQRARPGRVTARRADARLPHHLRAVGRHPGMLKAYFRSRSAPGGRRLVHRRLNIVIPTTMTVLDGVDPGFVDDRRRVDKRGLGCPDGSPAGGSTSPDPAHHQAHGVLADRWVRRRGLRPPVGDPVSAAVPLRAAGGGRRPPRACSSWLSPVGCGASRAEAGRRAAAWLGALCTGAARTPARRCGPGHAQRRGRDRRTGRDRDSIPSLHFRYLPVLCVVLASPTLRAPTGACRGCAHKPRNRRCRHCAHCAQAGYRVGLTRSDDGATVMAMDSFKALLARRTATRSPRRSRRSSRP